MSTPSTPDASGDSSLPLAHLVGPAIAAALADKGYDTLTPVQEAVLDEALNGRDLRITSQTGSGKTIALGLAVRDCLDDLTVEYGAAARPRVLVLTPTRELAKQVADELGWLFAAMRLRVAAITGGSSYVDQRRALSSNPAVVVATPGRLRDALEREKIDASALEAVVLDEADQMLDLGFQEDLEAILGRLPPDRRTHLVSATFSRDVVSLADAFQRDPVHVQGTKLGEANADIEHVVHLVLPDQRVDALINLLLEDPEAKSLVFARTRADVSRIAGELAEAGFVVRSLSGEMEQAERERALGAFRSGGVQALVATDVAARGIDVADIARVIQVEPPTDVETYTHRSGRTGRAGKHGTSVLFVSPHHYPGIARGLARSKIAHKIEPIPGREAIVRAREARMLEWIARGGDGTTLDAHTLAIADRLVKSEGAVEAVARLLERAGLHGPTYVREVKRITPPPPREERAARGERGERGERAPRAERPAGEFVPFHVSWGGKHGADSRRLLGMVCRRGGIEGRQVGAIKVDAIFSIVQVAEEVADAFEAAASKPDPRDPRVKIRRWVDDTGRREKPAKMAVSEREERTANVYGERPARPARASREDDDMPTITLDDAGPRRAPTREPETPAEEARIETPPEARPVRRAPAPRAEARDAAPEAPVRRTYKRDDGERPRAPRATGAAERAPRAQAYDERPARATSYGGRPTRVERVEKSARPARDDKRPRSAYEEKSARPSRDERPAPSPRDAKGGGVGGYGAPKRRMIKR
jgi:ATP-dependent RNA helicase DeaD